MKNGQFRPWFNRLAKASFFAFSLLSLVALASLFRFIPLYSIATGKVNSKGEPLSKSISLENGFLVFRTPETATVWVGQSDNTLRSRTDHVLIKDAFSVWSWVGYSAILPALWLMDRLVGGGPVQRRWRWRCGVCGYDLRASRDQCPECGTPVPHRPSLG